MKRGELFKIKREGKIGGVCAGIANYFGIETWLVRILTVTAFLLLAGPFILVAYVALWFILDDEPTSASSTNTYGHKGFVNSKHTAADGQAYYSGKGFKNNAADTHYKVEVKSKVWQAGVPPRQAFVDIKQRYETVENKLRKLESYVTSKEFELNRELSRL
ncbi:MAG: phage shock protein C [Patiriisocius sp.]|jgi:phage shock protein C